MKLLQSLFSNFCNACTTHVRAAVEAAGLHFILIHKCFSKPCFNTHGVLTLFSTALLFSEQNWFFQTAQIITPRVMSYQERAFEDFEPRGKPEFLVSASTASCVTHCHKGGSIKCPGWTLQTLGRDLINQNYQQHFLHLLFLNLWTYLKEIEAFNQWGVFISEVNF